MEIERINENTIKFYISYGDIEERGFEREEIWYNRDSSEKLFWDMMEEVNYKEDFNPDGPLWIQVQALEKGLEIVVTKAKVSKNGENLELDAGDGTSKTLPMDEKIENLLDDKFGKQSGSSSEEENDALQADNLWIIVELKEFEDMIQLSHYFSDLEDVGEETLYHYDNKYYLYLEFSHEVLDEQNQEDIISLVLEYADDSDISVHLLEEYGKVIFDKNAFTQVRSYFTAKV